MYDEILVPTDGSEGTKRALEHAIGLAETYGARLHTLYAVDTHLGLDSSVPGTLDALERAGQAEVDAVVEEASDAGVETAEGAVLHGRPHEAILEYVDDHGIELIVMGTHGRTGLDRYLLGSVTEKVVRTSEVPVVTIPLRGSETVTEE